MISCRPVETLHTENQNDTDQIVLTRETIQAMLDSLQCDADNRFASDVCEHFAPDARIIMYQASSHPNVGSLLELGLEEYRKELEASWSDVNAYSYLMKDIEITIQPDGKNAVVKYNAIEKTDFGVDHIRAKRIGMACCPVTVTSNITGKMSIIISDRKPKIIRSYTETITTSEIETPIFITLK
jgi:hypothetical protein